MANDREKAAVLWRCIECLPQMNISESGLLEWPTSKAALGSYVVKLELSDGVNTQQFSFVLEIVKSKFAKIEINIPSDLGNILAHKIHTTSFEAYDQYNSDITVSCLDCPFPVEWSLSEKKLNFYPSSLDLGTHTFKFSFQNPFETILKEIKVNVIASKLGQLYGEATPSTIPTTVSNYNIIWGNKICFDQSYHGVYCTTDFGATYTRIPPDHFPWTVNGNSAGDITDLRYMVRFKNEGLVYFAESGVYTATDIDAEWTLAMATDPGEYFYYNYVVGEGENIVGAILRNPTTNTVHLYYIVGNLNNVAKVNYVSDWGLDYGFTTHYFEPDGTLPKGRLLVMDDFFGTAAYYSDDLGATWNYNSAIRSLSSWSYTGAVDSIYTHTDGTVFMSTRDGLIKTTNKGTSYTKITNGINPEEWSNSKPVYNLMADSSGNIYVRFLPDGTTDYKWHISTDDGTSFRVINSSDSMYGALGTDHYIYEFGPITYRYQSGEGYSFSNDYFASHSIVMDSSPMEIIPAVGFTEGGTPFLKADSGTFKKLSSDIGSSSFESTAEFPNFLNQYMVVSEKDTSRTIKSSLDGTMAIFDSLKLIALSKDDGVSFETFSLSDRASLYLPDQFTSAYYLKDGHLLVRYGNYFYIRT